MNTLEKIRQAKALLDSVNITGADFAHFIEMSALLETIEATTNAMSIDIVHAEDHYIDLREQERKDETGFVVRSDSQRAHVACWLTRQYGGKRAA